MRTIHALAALIVTATIAHANPIAHHEHPTQNSYKTSNYNYVWDLVRDEYTQHAQTLKPQQRKRYRELAELFVRAGANFGFPVLDISGRVTELYPELLELDPDPPLYFQYRYHTRRAEPMNAPVSEEFIGIADDLLDIARRMEEARYDHYTTGAVYIRAAEFLRGAPVDSRQRESDARARGLDLLLRAARLESVPPEQQEFVATRIAHHAFKYSALEHDDRVKLIDDILADPRADHWIAHWAAGELYSKAAWDIRGSGYANTVTNEQWQGFYRELAKSYQHLVRAWELHPERPEPIAKLISLTMAHQFEDERHEGFWFEQATAARQDLIDTYENLAWAMLPRWGGTPAHLRAIIEHAIEQGKDNHDMLRCALSALSIANQARNQNTDLLHEPEYLAALVEMAQREIAHPTPSMHRTSRAVTFRTIALGAFETGDYATASMLLTAGGHEATRLYNAWTESARFYDYAPLLAHPAHEHVIFMMHALESNNPDRAREHLIDAIAMLEDLESQGALPESTAPDPVPLLRKHLRTLDRRPARSAP